MTEVERRSSTSFGRRVSARRRQSREGRPVRV